MEGDEAIPANRTDHKVLHWLDRFGWAELAGIAGSYGGWLAASALLAGPALGPAYGAAMGENCGYYAVIFLRDWRAAPPASRSARRTLGAMIHDFGLAEVLDSLAVRPGLTLLAVSLLGAGWGVGAGKLAADVVFYLLAIMFYERRRQREGRR
ncbi:MAG: hypothetical protein KDE15_06540 [Erythrobacter sp.]|nr:hypothetical protein [Erythrobacter sp.]